MDILLLSKYELHELVEEQELEWISNKDAFPLVESFVDICPNHPSIISSPLSVLENVDNFSNANSVSSGGDTSSTSATASLTGSFQKLPVKPRSKMFRKRRREIPKEGFPCWDRSKPIGNRRSSTSGRKCLHCGSEKTPQWRAGPSGPKTLCNACGVRYKSGRLVPEYRPACSPTFSSALHSNSHRKIVEMRKQKMGSGTGSRYSEDDEDSNLKSTVLNMSA